MLLKPHMERLVTEFHELQMDLNLHPAHEEGSLLRQFIHRKIRQLEMLHVAMAYLENNSESSINSDVLRGQVGLPDIYETYKQIKLELRFSKRKWQRILRNESRFPKTEERELHASTFAA